MSVPSESLPHLICRELRDQYWHPIQKAFQQPSVLSCESLDITVLNYTLARDSQVLFTRLTSSEYIDKVAQELQVESAWTDIKRRTDQRAQDAERLEIFLQIQRGQSVTTKLVANVQLVAVKLAQHRLQPGRSHYVPGI